ncbi:hypothetical protein NH8B_1070 [Pseudogulbenkiania sp. NH8B]|uniref:Uncharacterized protein n=2 Tax=Pseudogulbenkiania TaxID=568394 RepID=A0A1Y6BIR0_9NEIS|nr:MULTISPECIES: hypothetical protein [Pseudogulbenkiania]EEG09134.1 conserved hypothetical protein [Pseudogulbenkiania ferrooxidans 2002]BAK75901.1 hypothetical protein NH8B_1070 [Pseudogulbenkiania sp. NH8B]SMF13717.1 hypothetical protein SAMN02745746_01498 [Pseudogulbenkiania subflava DSM 22618]
MRVSQLQPGCKIVERKDDGHEIRYEVISIRQIGKQFEVTFRSVLGMASALYSANAFIPTAA